MSDIAIRVEGLSKQYRIGGAQGRYQTFREAILRAASAPMRWAKGERQDPSTIWALDDVSFEVKQGEVIGVIGRNGAGKSTLLKILSRITKPTRGRVELNGRVGSLLEVGTGFHPELTGRENVFLNGAILGMTRREIERKFDEIVDFSGVEKFIDTPVKRYSSGMQVRLAFSVAAHLEPEILLVDEVLAVGDAEFQKKSLGKMDEVSKTGRTVLFVSHNMDAITTFTQKCFLIEKGSLLLNDKTAQVVSHYSNTVALYNESIYINKTPNSEPHITRVEVITSDAGNIQQNGEPMSIQVELSIPHPISEARLACQIVNSKGVPVVLLSTVDTEKEFGEIPGTYIIKFDIPMVRLYKDFYSLTLNFAQSLHLPRFQKIEGVCPFNVAFYERPRKVQRYANACIYVEEFECEIQGQ